MSVNIEADIYMCCIAGYGHFTTIFKAYYVHLDRVGRHKKFSQFTSN